MSYKVGADVAEGSKYLPGGIHENVTLTKIALEPMSKTNNTTVLVFYFEKSGYQFIYKEFPVNEEGVRTFAQITNRKPSEVKSEMIQQIGARLTAIMSCFMPLSEINLDAESFEDLGKAIIEQLSDKIVGEQVRIKIVYNKAGYTTFPKRAFTPFIQNMREPNAIVINPKYDNVTPPVKTDNTDDSKQDFYNDPEAQDADFAPAENDGYTF
jgi:hypothetical protein